MIVPLKTTDGPQGMPRSYWTKTAIIETAIAAGCNEQSIAVLRALPAPDVKAICLVRSGLYLCGGKGRFNHCKYYRVDIDFIKSLGGADIDAL